MPQHPNNLPIQDYATFKLQFVGLIGGRVAPRLGRVPQLGRQFAVYQSFMQAISALKHKGVASLFQFVVWHKLSSM